MIASDSNTLQKTLTDLVRKNRDAQQGYHKAAEDVEVPNLVSYFKTCSQQRKEFVHELESEMKVLGLEVPNISTSWQGDIHQLWMDLRSVLASDSEDAVLQETIRGDNSALEEYASILDKEDLPESTGRLLRKQKAKIEMDLYKNRQMEAME